MRSNGLMRTHFVAKESANLNLFMPLGDVKQLELALAERQDPDADGLRRILPSSKIGATLFADCGAKLDYAVYVKTVELRLDDLEHLDFTEADVFEFRKLMSSTAKNLTRHGQRSYDRKQSTVNFMTVPMKVSIACLADEWVYRLAARLNTISANSVAVILWAKVRVQSHVELQGSEAPGA